MIFLAINFVKNCELRKSGCSSEFNSFTREYGISITALYFPITFFANSTVAIASLQYPSAPI
jgi:hypothetical protein